MVRFGLIWLCSGRFVYPRQDMFGKVGFNSLSPIIFSYHVATNRSKDLALGQSTLSFFAQTMHIQLASPQAAKLDIGLLENQYCYTSARDLIKDAH